MSILPSILASAIGIFSFLFLFWKRLKEDYSAPLIFSAGFSLVGFVLAGSFIFNIASKYISTSGVLNPAELWFWGAFVGFLVGLWYSIVKFKLKSVEILEASALGFSVWLALGYMLNFFKSRNVYSGLLGVAVVISIVLFYFLDKRYKSFSWYKSGRLGFSGIFVSGFYFTLRVIFASLAPTTFSIIGKIDIIFSAVVAFLLFFSLYNLSER